jgi:hypothetical protein
VVTDALLFVVSVSGVSVATTTSLVIKAPLVALFGRTTMVTVCCAPLPSVPNVQATVLLPGPVGAVVLGRVEQDPVDGVADRKVSPAGNVSVIRTTSAELSPLAMLVAVTM